MNNKLAEKLADFIEKHPDCKFEIDNDVWYITEPIKREKTPIEIEMKQDYEENQIADSSDYGWSTQWYGHSSNYGAGLAEAMVIILNRRGFKIVATAV